VGAIRLKLEHSKLIIFQPVVYADMLNVLKENEYHLLVLLGKSCNTREDVAKCMIRILEDGSSALDFVRSVVKQEINGSDDYKTLFRANSMATKALDVYMKHVGTGIPYLTRSRLPSSNFGRCIETHCIVQETIRDGSSSTRAKHQQGQEKSSRGRKFTSKCRKFKRTQYDCH
jgi:hypothetical protein